MSLNPLVGRDGIDAPLLADFRHFGNRLVQTFHDQPLLIRRLAPYVTPIAFDGKNETETPTWDDIEDAEYGMVPGESNVELGGTSVITKLPQIYKSAERLIDHWKLMFANRDRLPIILGRLRQKVKIKEDVIGFRGDTPNAVKGIVSTATHDLGGPSGNWKIDANADGILENAQADIEAALDWFASQGLAQYPVDIAMSFPIYNKLKNFLSPYREGNNLAMAIGKLNGGMILPSNNIQANVTSSANTMIAMVRVPVDEAGWGLLSSEIEQEVFRTGYYTWGYSVREKFSIEVIDGNMIAWMDGISVA